MARFAVGVVGFFELLLAMTFAFFAANPWMDSMMVPVFGSRILDSVVFVTCTIVTSGLAAGLYTRRSSAWWLSRFGSGLLALGGVAMIGWEFRAGHVASHAGVTRGTLLCVPSGIAFCLLSLPAVRRHFHKSRRHKKRRRHAARRRASASTLEN